MNCTSHSLPSTGSLLNCTSETRRNPRKWEWFQGRSTRFFSVEVLILIKKRILILAFGALAISGSALLVLKKLLGLRRETFHLCPVGASSVDLLLENFLGEFPVKISENEFEMWGMEDLSLL